MDDWNIGRSLLVQFRVMITEYPALVRAGWKVMRFHNKRVSTPLTALYQDRYSAISFSNFASNIQIQRRIMKAIPLAIYEAKILEHVMTHRSVSLVDILEASPQNYVSDRDW